MIWGSIAFYFMFSFTLYSPAFYSLAVGGVGYVGMAINVFSSGIFWLTIVITAAVCLLPIVGYRWMKMKLRPTLSDLIRKGEWKERRTHAESLVSFSYLQYLQKSSGTTHASYFLHAAFPSPLPFKTLLLKLPFMAAL